MPDGLVYVGLWRDGQINGKGKLTQPNNDVYDGDLVSGQRQGQGRVTYANGDIYEGAFADDRREAKAHSQGSTATSTPAIGSQGKSRAKGA